jgi:hypothetical protein
VTKEEYRRDGENNFQDQLNKEEKLGENETGQEG